ncbi:MAG: AAA family ATPase, partial [Klebsiella pneumoniae]|nr:AAA family ATPase [Klebsiella pneumoniae]
MSNLSLDFSDNAFQPLAARMRPENLAQYIGQQHLLAPGKPLPRAIEAGHLHSMILWGPPGTGKTTLAEVIARFNKSQQDAFLPHIEDGTITFIGATTENPSFELNSALLSRARVYLLKSLTTDDIERVLDQAMNDKTRGYGGQDIILPDETRRAIAELVNGDARRALNTLEMMADMAESDDSGKRVLKAELLTEIAGERSARFDNKGDRFY